jgi:hypothetical protein
VWLVGSTAELGNWCPSCAFKLKWSEGHIWRGTLELPSSTVDSKLEFKASNLYCRAFGLGVQYVIRTTSVYTILL